MKILFVLLLALGCYANPTGSELKKTPSTAFDFTMVPSNDIKETLQDMIMVEIGKELFLERRKNNLWQCQTDQFGTAYCPTGLATARPYTAYYQSTTYERESAVMDYQTGSAITNTASVIDYAAKEIASNNVVSGTANFNYSASFCTDHFTKVVLVPDGNDVHFILVAQSPSGGTDGRCGYRDYSSSWLQSKGVAGWKVPTAFKRINIVTFANPVYSVEGFKFTFSSYGNGCSKVSGSGTGNTSRSSSDPYAYGYAFDNQSLTNCGANSAQKPTVNINFSSIYTRTLACPAGYADNGSNCKKTVSYALYQYTCPSGYTVANAGLTTCAKTDPNTTTDNTSTLDDACNSATPPVGNCSKSISYKYYEYLCQAKNSFLEPIKNLNSGLKSPCSKTDSDKTKDNTGTLDDACNSSTPPTNNCQSTEYTCNSALFKPVYVDGKWVCSPYLCNDDMKCGYGTCDLPTTPSTTKYQDIAYNPLGTINDNRCNGDTCDFVVNARVTYCESKQCPKGDDIIEKNGKCYKLECPAGTYLSGEKCIKVN